MAMSEARKRANKKWNDENLQKRYDRIQLVVPKGEKDKIKAAAQAANESVNSFIGHAIELAMAGGFGIPDGNAGDNVISRSISLSIAFSDSDMEKLTALLEDGQTVEDYVKAAVLEKMRTDGEG
ncbi:MAG: hypothetical protein LUE89_06355 [Clostridiales bacterium]|nr:hypothetical protein [Clostridiales bacterium]